MFSDYDVDSSGFSSNWKYTRTSEDSSVQTTEIVGLDKEVQAKDQQTVLIQTEDEIVERSAPVYDENRLAEFLGKICPEIVKELDKVSRSNAFASYTSTAEADGEVREVLTLAPNSTEGVKVSELSWSCTGSVLAVALSHTLHSSWCSHQGLITLYNVDRESRKARRTLEAPSCIRSVCMHPFLSSIIAAGTFSGEVLVWDIAREGSEAVLLNVTRTIHNDLVSHLRWVLGTGTTVTLVSSALDGHIIFWKVSPKLSSYQLLERYSCDSSSTGPGVTCFAFPYHQQNTFVVALEGGALLHCSTTAAKPIASVNSTEVIKDPVISIFETEPVTVTSIEFSPHLDDVFATAATDQAIRIYSLFQNCTQSVICGVGTCVGLSWSPSQAHLLASWGAGGAVTLYNSQSSDVVCSLTPDNVESKSDLTAAAFNAKSPCLLAVGDLDGISHVWEIPLHTATKPKLV